MTAGMLLVAASMIAVSRVGLGASFHDLAPPLVLGGVGFGLTTTPSTAAVLASAPAEQGGVASGVVNMFRQVGGALGIAVMGAILAFRLHGIPARDPRFAAAFVAGYQRALLAGATVAFAGAVAALVLVRSRRPPTVRSLD
jgi:DHA2 family multidrug resistance protein-like MFS transporter